MRSLMALVFVTACVSEAQPLSIAVLDWSGSGLDAAQMASFTEAFANRLAAGGAKVSTPRAIAAVVGIERQRELLGCSSASSSCVAEIAAALGTETIALGDVVKTSKALRLSLKVIAARDGSILSTWEGAAASDDELYGLLGPAAEQLALGAATRLGRATPKARSWWFLLPTGAAVAAGLGALVTQTIAGQRYAAIPTASGDARGLTEVRQLRAEGEAAQWGTRGLLLVGVAGLVTGAIMFISGLSPSPASPLVVLLPDGGVIGVGVRL